MAEIVQTQRTGARALATIVQVATGTSIQARVCAGVVLGWSIAVGALALIGGMPTGILLAAWLGGIALPLAAICLEPVVARRARRAAAARSAAIAQAAGAAHAADAQAEADADPERPSGPRRSRQRGRRGGRGRQTPRPRPE